MAGASVGGPARNPDHVGILTECIRRGKEKMKIILIGRFLVPTLRVGTRIRAPTAPLCVAVDAAAAPPTDPPATRASDSARASPCAPADTCSPRSSRERPSPVAADDSAPT